MIRHAEKAKAERKEPHEVNPVVVKSAAIDVAKAGARDASDRGHALEESMDAHISFWERAKQRLEGKEKEVLDEMCKVPEETRNKIQKPEQAPKASFARLASDNIEGRLRALDDRKRSTPFGIRRESIDEVLKKVYGIAKIVKDNGDGLVGCDPTGYAKAAWLPFCIILNVSKSFALTIEGVS